MKVGDHVEWTSQAGGFYKTKRGVIVAVVPHRAYPRRHLPEGFRGDGLGAYRNGESYLVQIGASKILSWPRVKHLRKIEDGTP